MDLSIDKRVNGLYRLGHSVIFEPESMINVVRTLEQVMGLATQLLMLYI